MRLVCTILIFFCSCSHFFENKSSAVNNYKFRKLSTYPVDFNKKIISRVTRPPAVVLEYLNKLDNAKYDFHVPDFSENQKIQKSLSKLPPAIKSILQKKLVGIYFVNDFATNGLMDYVVDEKNNLYGFLVFRTEVLHLDISESLTSKEKTIFIPDDSGFNIRMEMGKKSSALNYILLHESIHLLDLTNRISPWLEPAVKKLQIEKNRSNKARLIDDIWTGYKLPLQKFDFHRRNQITFYGFQNGPKIRMQDVVALYSSLAQSPFVSLYGATIWPEDLAELLTFYALKKYYGMELRINISKNNRNIRSFQPLEFPLVKKRLEIVKNII